MLKELSDLMSDCPEEEETTRRVETKMFWQSVSKADIKKQFTDSAISLLQGKFTKEKTKEIVEIFKELIEEI